MKWQRHPGRRILDGNPSCSRMGLHKLVEVIEDGLGHGIDCVGAQSLARYEKIDDRYRLNRFRLPLIGACWNDRGQISRIANFQYCFLRY